jgi:hypothetical protein
LLRAEAGSTIRINVEGRPELRTFQFLSPRTAETATATVAKRLNAKDGSLLADGMLFGGKMSW